VIRSVQGGGRLLGESSVPTEAELHKALMEHPALVPAADLGFDRMVTVGFEASLASGSADLVLLDARGQLCVVEVKKEGNTDTRRVIAQLLDYASALWGLTLDEFEQRVLRSRLARDDPRTLAEFIRDELIVDVDDPEETSAHTCELLAETLRSGDFALVVAAPSVPSGVERQIEYLNARGLSVYALEVSYFADDADTVFVPRIVARPTAAARIAGRDPRPEVVPEDPEGYLEGLGNDHLREAIRQLLDDVPGLGGELHWRSSGGPRVRVRGGKGPKVILSLSLNDHWYLTIGPLAGMPAGPGQHAAERLRALGVNVGATYGTLKWEAAETTLIASFLDVARDLVRELAANSSD
jgi:hypothetical protein